MKLSYFALFPDDWLSSGAVCRMTLEEQGAYVRLLCFGWALDGIPADQQELALLLGLEPGSPRASSILRRVIDLAWKPDVDNPRILRNDRQELERAKSARLYELKLSQIEKARAANPRNAKGSGRSKALIKPLSKALGDNHNHTLLREERAQMSEPGEANGPEAGAAALAWASVKAGLKPQAPEPEE